MKKVKVIYNPYAGRWMALQKREEAETALRKAGLDYELVMTERPGHGTELAAHAVREGNEIIVSAGGDGSISEVVNGMMVAVENTAAELPRPRLGILPLGTANDLVINLGLPVALDEAAKVIAGGRTRFLDLGEIQVGADRRSQLFDNNSAIGLEPTVTLIQQQMRRVRGVLRYLLATLAAVNRNPQWRLTLTWDSGAYEGPATLVTVGNTPKTGGLFYMTPHADPFDGKLTFVHGYMATRLKILQLLPRTMKSGPGSYVEHPDIHEFHCTWLKIKTHTGTPVHADGEIQSSNETQFYYQVKPACLPVCLP